MSENVGALTCHNHKGLHGLYRENFTFCHAVGAVPMTVMGREVMVYKILFIFLFTSSAKCVTCFIVCVAVGIGIYMLAAFQCYHLSVNILWPW
jgi:hypothetical protein